MKFSAVFRTLRGPVIVVAVSYGCTLFAIGY